MSAAYWFAFLAAIGFSAKAILIKVAYAKYQLDAVTLLAMRMLFSLPFFWMMGLWGRARAESPIERRDWFLLALLGFLGNYLSSLLDFFSLHYITAALERLILFTYPAIVLLLSFLFLRKRAHGREVLSMILSFTGIAIVFGQDLRFSEQPRAIWTGGALVFGAAFSYSIYLVISGGVIRRIGSHRFTGVMATFSSFFVLGHFALTHPVSVLRQPPSLYLLVAALAVFSTAIPVWLTNEAIHRIGSSRVALIGSIGPIATMLMGAAFLSEHVTPIQIVGSVLVLGGVLLAGRIE